MRVQILKILSLKMMLKRNRSKFNLLMRKKKFLSILSCPLFFKKIKKLQPYSNKWHKKFNIRWSQNGKRKNKITKQFSEESTPNSVVRLRGIFLYFGRMKIRFLLDLTKHLTEAITFIFTKTILKLFGSHQKTMVSKI